MPESISVAAFVVGLVLIVAALVGKPVKIAAVELPDLTRPQRSIVGALGLALVVFGLFDGRWPLLPTSSPSPTAPSDLPSTQSTSPLAVGECFADLAKANRIKVAVESARQTNMRFGSGQPRDDVFALQVMSGKDFVGSVKLKSLASGSGFDILNVVDSACNPLTTYENATRPNQPPNAPYTFDTLHYHFGETVIAIEIFYKEEGVLELRGQLIASSHD